jgi:hypothetical protein
MGGSLRSEGGDRSGKEDGTCPFDDASLVNDSFRGEGSAELAVEPEFGASSVGIAGSFRSSERRRSALNPPNVGAGTSRRIVALLSMGGNSPGQTGARAKGGPPDE